MRNKCKHKNVKILKPHAHIRWMWCEGCGATRMDTKGRWHPYPYYYGKWKSPKNVVRP